MNRKVEMAGSRGTAGERREDVLREAIDEFATYGYHGGSTRRIAAGISQPYVQRLYGTKTALFIAALDRVAEDILSAWRRQLRHAMEDMGADIPPAQRLDILRPAYETFFSDVVGLRLVLQAAAAAAEPEIARALKQNMKRMFAWVREATGASYEDVRTFWAQGMTLTMAASLGAADDVHEEEWPRAMLMMPNEPPAGTSPEAFRERMRQSGT
jgi:AcrR family transcriptional regulator